MNKNTSFILYPEQSYFIWKASWLSLISCLYAIYQNYIDLALVPGGVFITSLIYWRKPDYSWRRTLDMNYVRVALLYQILRSYGAEYGMPHFLSMILAVSCFPLSWKYYNDNRLWESVYIHCLVHLFGNIGNIILYSGEIQPIYMNPVLKLLL